MKPSQALLILASLASSGHALAEDAKADGQWRGNGGAAMTISSGNTNSKSLNLTANGARLTANDKLSVYLQMLASRAESTTSGLWVRATTTPSRVNCSGLAGWISVTIRLRNCRYAV